MRLQYASDLHLEFTGPCAFPLLLRPVAPVLVLAGDIGRPDKPGYVEMLRWASRNWDHVVVVAGNHELYNDCDARRWKYKSPGTIHTAAQRLEMAAAVAAAVGPTVHFLERRRVDIGGWAFLGTTLWTERPAGLINDYRLIAVGEEPRPLQPADVMAWHHRDRAWLAGELAVCAEEEIPAVVVTHHLPSRALISERFAGSPINCEFASDCYDLLRPPVRAWIAGHTHVGITCCLGGAAGGGDRSGVQIGVNPRGYPGEGPADTGYCRELFMDLEAGARAGTGATTDPLLRSAAVEPPSGESACAPAPQMLA